MTRPRRSATTCSLQIRRSSINSSTPPTVNRYRPTTGRWSGCLSTLRAPATDGELTGERDAVGLFRSEVRIHADATAASRPTTRSRRSAGTLVAIGVLTVGTVTGAAAATGNLPDAVQHLAAVLLSEVGINVPDAAPVRDHSADTGLADNLYVELALGQEATTASTPNALISTVGDNASPAGDVGDAATPLPTENDLDNGDEEPTVDAAWPAADEPVRRPAGDPARPAAARAVGTGDAATAPTVDAIEPAADPATRPAHGATHPSAGSAVDGPTDPAAGPSHPSAGPAVEGPTDPSARPTHDATDPSATPAPDSTGTATPRPAHDPATPAKRPTLDPTTRPGVDPTTTATRAAIDSTSARAAVTGSSWSATGEDACRPAAIHAGRPAIDDAGCAGAFQPTRPPTEVAAPALSCAPTFSPRRGCRSAGLIATAPPDLRVEKYQRTVLFRNTSAPLMVQAGQP